MKLPTPVSLCGSSAFARRRPRARHLLLLVAVAGSLVLSGAAQADVIVLENGHRLEGRIESESADAVVLARGSGTLTIDRRRIAAIERDEPAGDTTEGAPAPTEPPQRPTPPPRPVPTRFAPPRGIEVWRAPVTYEARGDGISTMRVALTSKATTVVSVLVPAGTLFVAREWKNYGAPQDMLAVADGVVRVPPGGEAELEVPVACARMRLRIPSETDIFDVKEPTDGGLASLGRALKRESDWKVKQAAVWIVTDDASYEGLGTLQTRSTFELSGRRTIGVSETVRALWRLDTSGVDVRARRIWADRFLLLHALSPPPAAKDGNRLARWARSCWRELGYPEDISALLTRVVEDPSASPPMLSEARRIARSERLTKLVLALDRRIAEGGDALPAAAEPAPREAEAPVDDVPEPAPQPSRASPSTSRRIGHLLVQLRDRDPDIQSEAVRALNGLASSLEDRRERKRVADALFAYGRDRLQRTTTAAILGQALRAYRDAVALPSLLTLSRSRRLGERERPAARLLAAKVLAAFPEPAASERLVEMLEDEDAEVRRAAGHALQPTRANAQGALLDLLRSSKDVGVRQAAVRALRTHVVAGSALERTMIQLLGDDDREVRMVAVGILGTSKSESAARPLIGLLDTDLDSVRKKRVVNALVRIGRPALPAIQQALSRGDDPLLQQAKDRIEKTR